MTSRRSLIAALLAGTLVLTAALAFQAFRAAAQRRAVASAALRDYATFAAAELVRRSREELDRNAVIGNLMIVTRVNASLPTAALPTATMLEQRVGRPPAIDLRDSVRTWFRLVMADGSLSTARDSLSAATAAWLRDSIPVHARMRMAQNGYSGIIGGTPGEESVVAAYMMRYDATGSLGVIYGAVLPVTALAPIFAALHAGAPLLPRASAPIDNASALAVEVRGADGTIAYSSGPIDYFLVAGDTVGRAFGGLTVRLAPRFDAADRLVIGGLPSIPMVPLLGAVVLVAGLLGVAMLQLRREAELARLRDDFVAGVSHELRTPLAQIRLFAETLLLDRLRTPEERDRALHIVHDESRRLSQLVENLLQFSRTGRPPDRPVAADVPLHGLAREVVEQFTPLASQRGVRLTVDGPAVSARGDRDAVRQILLNLLDNALRYGPDGQQIMIRTVAAHPRVRLVVDDEGPGIPSEERERVFERFSRLTTGPQQTGTGLGLAVVKELVEVQQGSVAITANDRGGCRVVVELPAWTGT